MHWVGLGGFQNFDAALATPQVVDKRLAYMTPKWKDAFKYATVLADQLGLDEAIAGSPGWSESGGPWVPGPEAMKKYVWSETVVEGGEPFTGTLAHPPTNNGPFQNLPAATSAFSEPQFYADSTVVAYRAPAGSMAPQPKITWSSGTIEPALLTDGDLVATTSLPSARAAGEKAWIQYEYPQPQRICALTIVRRPRVAPMTTILRAPERTGAERGHWKRATTAPTSASSLRYRKADPPSTPLRLLRSRRSSSG